MNAFSSRKQSQFLLILASARQNLFAKPDGMAVRSKVRQTINEDDFFSFLFLGIRCPLLGIVSSLSDPVVVLFFFPK